MNKLNKMNMKKRNRLSRWHMSLCVCVEIEYSFSNCALFAFYKVFSRVMCFCMRSLTCVKIKSPGYSCARPDCLRGHAKLRVPDIKSFNFLKQPKCSNNKSQYCNRSTIFKGPTLLFSCHSVVFCQWNYILFLRQRRK